LDDGFQLPAFRLLSGSDGPGTSTLTLRTGPFSFQRSETSLVGQGDRFHGSFSELGALQVSFLIFLKLDFNLPSVSRRVSKILPHGGNDNQCGRRGTRTTVLNHTSIVPEAGGNPQCQLPTLPSETDHLVHPSFSRGTNRREPLSDHRLRWGLGSKSKLWGNPN
jgi:hypothetical protein